MDISNYSENDLKKIKALDIWEEPEIEEGTLCKFWYIGENKRNFFIGYYGGKDRYGDILMVNNNNTDRLCFGNCEPITEIPKYRF